MARERSAARQPKIIKKEPSVAVAKSAQAPEVGTDEATADHWVHLDIPAALPGISINDNMQIILEGVPDGARLSAGRNNGDKTWSLSPDELVDLGFLPPSGRDAEGQSFFLRLLTFDPDGYQIASTTAQVAFTMDGIAASRRIRGGRRTDQGEPAVDAIRDIEFSERLAAAEAAWRAGEEQRFAEAHAAWETETETRLAALEETLLKGAADRHEQQDKAAFEVAVEERLKAAEAAWTQREDEQVREIHDRLWQEYSRRLREAETEWHRQESERMSAALAQAADFTAQRLSAAEEQWHLESDKRLAELEAEWRAEAERQVELARQRWESGAADNRAATSSLSADGITAEDLAQQIETATAAVRAEIERQYLERLAAAEAAANQRVAEVEAAWKIEREELLARLAGSNDEAVMERLAAAEMVWRQETDRRIAEATDAIRHQAARQLAEAEASWRVETERRVDEAVRAVSPDGVGQAELMRTRLSEVERLAGEAERRIVEREDELERKFNERLAGEVEWNIAERQKELERSFAERQLAAEADIAAQAEIAAERGAHLLADKESEWRDAEAERLRIAEATWHQGEAERLRVVEATWREGEAERLRVAQELWHDRETERFHSAEAAWREAEAERLKAAETSWQAGETARLAAAESQWRATAEERVATALAAERKMLVGRDVAGILAEAEARWKQAEIVRLAEAEIRWKFAEDQRVVEATAGAREEIERLVEARLHRELAVGARKSVTRSHRSAFPVGRLLRTMAALTAVVLAGLAAYQYFPEIHRQLELLEPTAPAAVAGQPDPTVKTPSNVATGNVLFAAEFANMRAEPSSTARIVSTVDKGAKLVELDRSRGWVKVAPHDGSGAQGWVHGSLLRPAPSR